MLKGGDSGPAVVPRKPDESLADPGRPPDARRPQDAAEGEAARPGGRRRCRSWVKMGAPWPSRRRSRTAEADDRGRAGRTGRSSRSRPAAPPAVKDPAWVATPVDAFILARLEAKGLAPSPPADRRTLIRRATFDLTGLPPTPEEVDGVRGRRPRPTPSPRSSTACSPRPRYGERWGRHWLDVARYADTKGYVFTRGAALSLSPTPTATTSSGRSTTTCPTTGSSSSRSPPTSSPSGDDPRPLAAHGLPDRRPPVPATTRTRSSTTGSTSSAAACSA